MMKSSRSLSQTSIDRFDALKRGSNVVGTLTGFSGVSIIDSLSRVGPSIGEDDGNSGGSSISVSIEMCVGSSATLSTCTGGGLRPVVQPEERPGHRKGSPALNIGDPNDGGAIFFEKMNLRSMNYYLDEVRCEAM
jgi:hypothetical protein